MQYTSDRFRTIRIDVSSVFPNGVDWSHQIRPGREQSFSVLYGEFQIA
jgi:hypothetical protein